MPRFVRQLDRFGGLQDGRVLIPANHSLPFLLRIGAPIRRYEDYEYITKTMRARGNSGINRFKLMCWL